MDSKPVNEKEELGDILVKEELITREQLEQAKKKQEESGIPWLRNLMNTGRVPLGAIGDALRMELHSPFARRRDRNLGDILLEMKAITQQHVDMALAEQKRTGHLLGRILVEKGFITPRVFTLALAKLNGMEFVDLEKVKVDPQVLDLLNENVVRKKMILPLEREGPDKLVIAIGNPSRVGAMDDVALVTGYKLVPRLAVEEELEKAIEKYYGDGKGRQRAVETQVQLQPKPTKPTRPLKEETAEVTEKAASREEQFEELSKMAQNLPVVKLVATVIEGAIKSRATDIHLDPNEPEMRVRYRIDGALHDVMSIPKKVEPPVISRLKILADMDITETRRPQDGHITFSGIGDNEYDLRVATLPTYLGERMVLRLLDPASVLKGLNELGMELEDRETFDLLLKQPYGMILLTGPTGSGKTTTLYAALNQMDVLTESIVTLEDPVEYQLNGINQVQIDSDIGVTFANTLRAVLRQDPDTILVGEIRDVETAHIAIRAAMTGHVIFSTLHTNNSPEAVSTLINMGVPPFLIASSLLAVIAQRLMRKICPNCKTKYKPTKADLQNLKLPQTVKTLYRGTGCDTCYHTGYLGRTAVFEVLVVDDTIKKMIGEGASTDEIAKAANLKTLADDARIKVRNGVTTADEFFNVLGIQ